MNLLVGRNIVGCNLLNRAAIHLSIRYQPHPDEIAGPLTHILVHVVVVGPALTPHGNPIVTWVR
jgi:hypothetical protein